MSRFGKFFRCFVQSAADKGLRGLAELVPGAGYLYDVVADAIRRMGDHDRNQQLAGLRAEFEAVAQPAPAEAVQAEAAQLVESAAPQLPPKDKEQLTLFLTLAPDTVRTSLRRPDDLSGTTVPAEWELDRPETLARMLPQRLPRHRGGDGLPGSTEWVLDRHLGVGGFGEVWLARHRDPNLSSLRGAVKFGLDLDAGDQRLLYEGQVINRVLASGDHPHIVPLLGANLTASPPWLMFKYIDGGDLTHLIHAWKQQPGPRRYELALTALRQLADAVGHFHALPGEPPRPVIHRDLKPANVLVRHQPGGGFTLLVADFGIGAVAARRALRDAQVPTVSLATMPTALRGAYTPLYASKQQRQFAPADVRDDVYALGVIWHQALLGDTTSDRPSGKWRKRLSEWGVPDAAMDLLEACCDDDPNERPKDAADLGRLLAALPGATEARQAGTEPKGPEAGGGHKSGVTPSRTELLRRKREEADRAKTVARVEELNRIIDEAVANVALRPHHRGPIEELYRLTGEPDLNEMLKELPPNELVNCAGMKLVWVPPGRFLMGSPAGEEGRGEDETQHWVTLTQGFYTGIHQVTQEQWQKVMGKANNPSHFKGPANLPVENVTWDDCQEFCRKLTQLDGRRYTLPTEAEWEYACRAGTTTPFYFGATISTDQANYDGRQTYGGGREGSYRQKTTPVGSFPANDWGLFDMHGNVWEWCQDAYGPYPAGETIDQLSDKLSDNRRVLRGGSWRHDPVYCRAACRFSNVASARTDYIGLRVVARLD